LAKKVVQRIERLRRRRLTGLEIAAQLELAVSTVSLWLRRLGLGRLRNLDPKPVVVRYEKKRPGELLHLDTKKLGRIKGIGHRITGNRRGSGHGLGWEFLHVCVDDATRVAYAEVLPDEKAVTATGFLERALAWFRDQDVLVERVMTDNGSCYRSHRFRRAVEAWGARQIHTRPYRAQRPARTCSPLSSTDTTADDHIGPSATPRLSVGSRPCCEQRPCHRQLADPGYPCGRQRVFELAAVQTLVDVAALQELGV
jgi:hypothetical protein